MDHTIALIRRSHDGDKEAREQLVEENIGLIWCVVRRFCGRGTETEDLFQIGCIGLLKAIDKFDLSYDVKFFYLRGAHDIRRDQAFFERRRYDQGQPVSEGTFLQKPSGQGKN